MSGLGFGLAVFAVLGVVGITGPDRNPVPLILLQLVALVVGGLVAGRFAPAAPAIHGGLAGLAMFLLIGLLAVMATAGPGTLELVALGLVAAVLGSAGGTLAALLRHPDE